MSRHKSIQILCPQVDVEAKMLDMNWIRWVRVFGEVLASSPKDDAVSVSFCNVASRNEEKDPQQSEYRSMIGDDFAVLSLAQCILCTNPKCELSAPSPNPKQSPKIRGIDRILDIFCLVFHFHIFHACKLYICASRAAILSGNLGNF